MPETSPRIVRAWLESATSGVIELESNWTGGSVPAVTLSPRGPKLAVMAPAPGIVAGRSYGFFALNPEELAFVLPLEHGCPVDPTRDRVYLAGDFNGWQDAVGRPEWELTPTRLDGENVLMWVGPSESFFTPTPPRFKFVTGEHIWLQPANDAPNVMIDDRGNGNRFVDRNRTGWHLWRFTTKRPLALSEAWQVKLGGVGVSLAPGAFFFDLHSKLPMGAIVADTQTTFRLFAPRIRGATANVRANLRKPADVAQYPLARRTDADGEAGVWEVVVPRNLHGAQYWYTLQGGGSPEEPWDPTFPVLDPWALATVDRFGPGIVLDRAWIGRADRSFATPSWHDLVIAEAHVRDLCANAPVSATEQEKRGFTGLKKWVESPEFYLHELGVNCVELQPVQEFDNRTPEEYHWGYMTNNYFSPESSYSLSPEEASGVRELQDVVSAFHRRGIAVLLDVVYNHVGEPAHLMAIDRLYYFEQGADGKLTNWSGCGNDLRARAAMARRLIIESCTHFIEAYGVDGFRFDLAELLGIEVLWDIEAALKRVKPDVILIAEPWSLRGHVAGALRDTGWASWNDGYRDFVREYVLGRGNASRLEYCLRGSPWYFAKWPAQTVNYTQSHDDRAWIDLITENPGGDGQSPTPVDRRRTHLMASILFMSIGIPMLASGQDFLHSKRGVNNSYQRGDLNALDYRRLHRFLGTHAYFADWIEFRLGPAGKLLRPYSRPSEGFFQFFRAADPAPLAVMYNADRSAGPIRLLYAVNPTAQDATVEVGPAVAALGPWRQIADHDRFYLRVVRGGLHRVQGQLFIPAMGCGLWICEA